MHHRRRRRLVVRPFPRGLLPRFFPSRLPLSLPFPCAENQNSIPRPPRGLGETSESTSFFLARTSRLCRSMTRLVIQEGEREKERDGQRRDSMELWQVEDGRPPWPAIVVSNLPADIRCRVTRVANAIDREKGESTRAGTVLAFHPSIHPSRIGLPQQPAGSIVPRPIEERRKAEKRPLERRTKRSVT